ncbi:hypothetical protein ASD99_01310 [Mesorhizobium sp. Root695]|nr:hypothetical protein ASD12_06805 [Mesorhizobium sp. Root102]KRB34295.1 hypothetical protein ASD99_01310 [Mesorhizobium sp. Root695]
MCKQVDPAPARSQRAASIKSIRERLWKHVQEHAELALGSMKRLATQRMVKPVLIGRVRHLRGKERSAPSILRDFSEEG